MTEPSSANVKPWYLRNITEALALDSSSGEVYLRTNAELTGNIVVGNVGITSFGNIDITGDALPIEGNVNAAVTGNVNATIISNNAQSFSTSAFGEQITVPIEPIMQLDGLYGLDPREFEVISASTGNAETTGTLMKCHTGTGAYGYGVLRSNRIIRYRPGQGAMGRFTAGFQNPQAGVTLRAGLFTQEQALQIGFDGTQFGVLRQNGGKAQIVELTVNSGGTGTTTITLDGVATTVSISSTDTTTVAQQIAGATFSGWIAQQIDNTVQFLSTTLGPKTGTYSMSGTGSGTFTTLQAGLTGTDNWTYQSSFNVDTLDGNGPSGWTIDPTKINVFQIDFRWLGTGIIRYAVEDAASGNMIMFHIEKFGNLDDVHINNPSFRMGYVAANLTANTITDSHTVGASMMGAIEGVLSETSFPTGINSDTKTSLGQNVYHSVLSVKNSLTYQNRINLRAVVLKTLDIAVTCNGPTRYYFVLNGTKSTGHTWQLINPFSGVIYDITEGEFTFSNEHPMAAFTLPANGSNTWNLDNLHLTIPPDSWIDLMVVGSQVINDVTASVTWIEI
jgi:hypothetical protein